LTKVAAAAPQAEQAARVLALGGQLIETSPAGADQ
jgi:hypothetical protein